ncbi:MAG TPA: DNA methyltransferase [Desulfotomaculum sp.]|nr:DNA methyltransferase [Desulfotomaculum sp.]
MKYNVLYADPGWKYDNQRTGGSHKSGAAQKYTVMSVEEICRLPVPEISDRNAVLFLWATVPMLKEGLQVMQAWGFNYKTKITWRKTGRLGLGYWFRGEIEELLFGVRGKIKAFRCQLPNFVEHPVLAHSEKPEIFREIIETATARTMENRKRIELFARRRVPGWNAWGNEIESDIDMAQYSTQYSPVASAGTGPGEGLPGPLKLGTV